MQYHHSFLTILAGVVFVTAFPSHKGSEPIQWINCTENVPPVFSASYPTFPTSTIPPNLKCGNLVVPMDYAKPISSSNNITLRLAIYRPVNPKGVIFYNGGGGDPNVMVAWQVAFGLIPAFDDLLDYDLMMMDTRGTFASNALNASEAGIAAIVDILGPFPRNQSAFNAAKASSAAFIKDVEEWSSPPGIVQYVSAREAAHDYEQVRIALCYDKVNFIALSYGSYRANQYAAYYPERVENFVLDAVVPHDMTPYYGAQTGLAALNRLMYRADAYCLQNSSCPFYGQGKGSVIAAYKKVLASAPLPAPNCAELSGNSSCSTTVTALNIQQAVSNDLESEGVDFPTLFSNIESALGGDASSFGSSGAVPSNIQVIIAATIALECGDNNYQKTTFEEWEKSLSTGLSNDPNQIGQSIAWELQLGCLAWPFKTPAYAPLITHIPMLLVTSDFDGSAPTEWADLMWEQSPKSVLVVRHGDDHTTFSLVDQPAKIIEDEFLRTGVLPAARSDDRVSVYTPGIKRAPIPDPYSVPTGEVAGDVNSGNLTGAVILP